MNTLTRFFVSLTLLITATIMHGISQEQHIEIKVFSGQEARNYATDIAHIRIHLFKEYPYLYQGSMEYEQEYLETYFSSEDALIVLVFDGDKVVGFSNSIPVAQESEEIKAPFIQHNLPLDQYLYIGEVMLYPAYRGKGILRKFFALHENKAKKEGYTFTTFMTVERPDNHPCKPNNYRPLEPIWRRFGYELNANLKVHLAWPQIDTNQETQNTLAIWQKKVAS